MKCTLRDRRSSLETISGQRAARFDLKALRRQPQAAAALFPSADSQLEWVDWFNNRRLLEPIGKVPPAEYEEAYYRSQEAHAMAA